MMHEGQQGRMRALTDAVHIHVVLCNAACLHLRDLEIPHQLEHLHLCKADLGYRSTCHDKPCKSALQTQLAACGNVTQGLTDS
jgi:hypothetical protein